jgi:hypothetical protein
MITITGYMRTGMSFPSFFYNVMPETEIHARYYNYFHRREL